MNSELTTKQVSDAMGGIWRTVETYHCYLNVQHRLTVAIDEKEIPLEGLFGSEDDIHYGKSDQEFSKVFRASVRDYVSPHNAALMMACLAEHLADWKKRAGHSENTKQLVDSTVAKIKSVLQVD